MPQTIDLQKAAEVDYEVQPYSSDKENGMTASRSDSSDVSSLSTLVGSEIENMVDHIDIEKAGVEVLGTQSSVGRSRARLLLWMASNTLASILIVRPNPLSHYRPRLTCRRFLQTRPSSTTHPSAIAKSPSPHSTYS